MKTEAEVQENIAGSKANLQKNLDNHHMSCRSGFMTQDLADQYEKTRAYMRGWIAFLEGKESTESTDEYKIGFTNAEKWLNDES